MCVCRGIKNILVACLVLTPVS